MTVDSIDTVIDLVCEMEAMGDPIGSVWQYINGMNNQLMYAVFPANQYCAIARSRLEAVDTGVPVKEAQRGQMGLWK